MKGEEDILDITQWTKRQVTSCFTPNMSNTTWTTTRAKERKRCTTTRMSMENRPELWLKMRMQKRKQKELSWRHVHRNHAEWRCGGSRRDRESTLRTQHGERGVRSHRGWRAPRAMRAFRWRGRFYHVTSQWRRDRKKDEEAGERVAATETEEAFRGRRWHPKIRRGEERHPRKRNSA